MINATALECNSRQSDSWRTLRRGDRTKGRGNPNSIQFNSLFHTRGNPRGNPTLSLSFQSSAQLPFFTQLQKPFTRSLHMCYNLESSLSRCNLFLDLMISSKKLFWRTPAKSQSAPGSYKSSFSKNGKKC